MNAKDIYMLITSLLDEDSRNIRRELKRRALVDTVNYVEKEMFQIRNDFDDRSSLLEYAISQITIPEGLWLEFGVYQGDTIRFIASKTSEIVYGFDSFQGNPENWRGEYPKGSFALPKPPSFDSNIVMVKGWFSDTLPEFIKTHHIKRISFVHVDCDLYSSAKTIFDVLSPQIIQGTVIVFDEFFNYPGWRNHEFKAFIEFIAASGKSFEYLGYVYRHSQVAIKIT